MSRWTHAAAAVAVATLFAAGCGDSGPLYAAKVFFEPNQPITGKNITMRVEVSSLATNAAVVGGAVNITGAGAGAIAKTVLTESDKPGVYVATNVLFPADGAYTLSLEMTGADGTETHSVPITATCGSNGEEGAPCCAADACVAGLNCVYGVCRSDLMGDGGPCHAAGECNSGVCTGEVCAVAACDDGLKNGGETDLDCGGTCDAKCGSLMGCAKDTDCLNGACVTGVCGLGPGELIGVDGKKAAPEMKLILDNSMANPADLAFSTLNPAELWVVNPPTDSFTVIFNAGKDNQLVATIKDYSEHFMEHVMAIDFSDNGSFGTCGESNNNYNNQAKGNNFMGPVLWPAQYSVYGSATSAHKVHWDMLHNTTYCMGITAITENQYFVFNGGKGAIDYYDFKKPHAPGGDYHGDGIMRRYSGVSVKRVDGVPSHLEYVKGTGWLYIADTGNKRVLRFDDSATKQEKVIQGFLGDGKHYGYSQPKVEELVPAPDGGLQQPSGIAVHGDTLYVGDAATGKIHAFDTTADAGAGGFGKHIKTFATGLPAGKLGGIEVGPDQRLYLLDRGGKLFRVDP